MSLQKLDHCTLCNASNFRVIHRRGQWQYLRCLSCSLVSLHPRPTPQELMRNYQNYLSIKSEETCRWQAMMNPLILKSAELIESRIRTGTRRLLDIGCGYGFFLQEMKSRGWQVQGIEVSQAGRQYAQDKWGIRVYPQPLEKVALPENSFDVTTLFYVIEHVHDPLGLLIEAKRVLKPGGLILVRWPHTTPILKILGPMSRRLDLYHTPYHLYDFSPKTIKQLLVLSGFREVETMIGGYTRPFQRLGRWASMVFGQLGEALYLLSGGNFLFPGISKTTLAFKSSI